MKNIIVCPKLFFVLQATFLVALSFGELAKTIAWN
jgi:hypothetical protein